MKELSDRQFDELLKQKVESFDHDFDEAAWGKMEQKLRRRDRIVFIRNSSFLLAFLMFLSGAYLLFENPVQKDVSQKIVKEIRPAKPETFPSSASVKKNNVAGANSIVSDVKSSNIFRKAAVTSPQRLNKESKKLQDGISSSGSTQINPDKFQRESSVVVMSDNQSKTALKDDSLLSLPAENTNPILAAIDSLTIRQEEKSAKRKRMAFSLTAQAGPELNSVKSSDGTKSAINVGVLFNASLSKITLSSGLRYSVKSYAASPNSYQLQNPGAALRIEGIDAACNILEIPLQVSYMLFSKGSKQIGISSGLSSYLMLKEEYNFRATSYSGQNNYSLLRKNQNQHYFSVLALSASYQINPKNSNLKWALEPYFKLPLGGVGEGNVRLRSSGVSLNLTYDLNKESM